MYFQNINQSFSDSFRKKLDNFQNKATVHGENIVKLKIL